MMLFEQSEKHYKIFKKGDYMGESNVCPYNPKMRLKLSDKR